MADDDKDLEFASKEDLEEIAKNPALQKIYNAMKAGVTKKFQSWSGERKQLTDTLGNYEGILKQWEEWRPVVDSMIAEQNAAANRGDDDEGDDDYRDWQSEKRGRQRERRREPVIDTTRQYLTRDEATRYVGDVGKELATMRRMFDLSLQLDDLRRAHAEKYPDVKFDTQKVLGLALDRGYQDLRDAYSAAYRDDFIKKDVDTQVATRLEEEKAKLRVPGETGSGAMPMHYKLPDETPKNFSDASRAVLEEIKAGTLTTKEK